MASKTILNNSLIADIAAKLRAGVFPKAACESLGVSIRSYHGWRKRGEEELSRRETSRARKSEQPFVDFFLETTKANAEAETFATLNIRRIATDKDTDARTRLDADKFFLQSRFRENWAPRINHDVTGEISYEVIISEPLKSSDDEYDDEDDD